MFFKENGTNENGYTLTNDIGHGSRNWREIRTIYDPEGVEIGTLTFNPTSPNVQQDMVVVKCDNSLLYEEDGISRFYAAIIGMNLVAQGISRIDIACDLNDFYAGLNPQEFITDLMMRKYIKVGLANRAFATIDFGYSTHVDHGELHAYNRAPEHALTDAQKKKEARYIEERNADIAGSGLPLIEKEELKEYQTLPIQHALTTALTWGKTGRAIQVQIYNKSKELREVKMKRYIVDAWKAAGLDLERDVWRVEFRIRAQGKELENLSTGEQFTLSTIDCVTQEQVEMLFQAYAEKYFKFFVNDGHAKIQNAPRLQLFNFSGEPVCRPKRIKKGTPTKYILSLANKVRAIGNDAYENGENDLAAAAFRVCGFFIDAYGLSVARDEEQAFKLFEEGCYRKLEMPVRLDAALHSKNTNSDLVMHKAILKLERIKAAELERAQFTPPPLEVDWEELERHTRLCIQKLVDPIEYRYCEYPPNLVEHGKI